MKIEDSKHDLKSKSNDLNSIQEQNYLDYRKFIYNLLVQMVNRGRSKTYIFKFFTKQKSRISNDQYLDKKTKERFLTTIEGVLSSDLEERIKQYNIKIDLKNIKLVGLI